MCFEVGGVSLSLSGARPLCHTKTLRPPTEPLVGLTERKVKNEKGWKRMNWNWTGIEDCDEVSEQKSQLAERLW